MGGERHQLQRRLVIVGRVELLRSDEDEPPRRVCLFRRSRCGSRRRPACARTPRCTSRLLGDCRFGAVRGILRDGGGAPGHGRRPRAGLAQQLDGARADGHRNRLVPVLLGAPDRRPRRTPPHARPGLRGRPWRRPVRARMSSNRSLLRTGRCRTPRGARGSLRSGSSGAARSPGGRGPRPGGRSRTAAPGSARPRSCLPRTGGIPDRGRTPGSGTSPPARPFPRWRAPRSGGGCLEGPRDDTPGLDRGPVGLTEAGLAPQRGAIRTAARPGQCQRKDGAGGRHRLRSQLERDQPPQGLHHPRHEAVVPEGVDHHVLAERFTARSAGPGRNPTATPPVEACPDDSSSARAVHLDECVTSRSVASGVST